MVESCLESFKCPQGLLEGRFGKLSVFYEEVGIWGVENVVGVP